MAWSERQAAMLKEMGLRVDSLPSEVSVVVEAARTASLRSGQVRPTLAPASPATTPATAAGATPMSPMVPTRSELPVPATDAHPIAAMDWLELRGAVADCRACQLCEGRSQTVFGVGHTNAHWMVVGEAPGEQEDEQGEPFVGKSGQLLDNMLRALGLSRAGVRVGSGEQVDPSRCVYIANSVKCRPPGNRNPTAEELAQCEPYLMRQVALLQPKIILAMGRFAVQSLLRTSDPIGKLRGRVHDYRGVPLIVTYHPAYLLRNLEEKARAWDDLCLAAQTYDDKTLNQRSP